MCYLKKKYTEITNPILAEAIAHNEHRIFTNKQASGGAASLDSTQIYHHMSTSTMDKLVNSQGNASPTNKSLANQYKLNET